MLTIRKRSCLQIGTTPLQHVQAVRVLIENIASMERAVEYAEKVGENDVWSTLARAQLGAGDVSSAIGSFLKASDISAHEEVGATSFAAGIKPTECWGEVMHVFLVFEREQGTQGRLGERGSSSMVCALLS